MARIDINLEVNGVVITQTNPVPITCGNKNYFYTVFKLSECWSDIVPTAIFGNFGQKPYSVSTAKVEGDELVYECRVPWEVLKDTTSFYVGLEGGDYLNTAPLTIRVNRGCGGDTQKPIEDGNDIAYRPDMVVEDCNKLYSEPAILDIMQSIYEKVGDEGPYTVSEMGNAIRAIEIPDPVEDGNEIAYGPETLVDEKSKAYNEPDIKDIAVAIVEKTSNAGPYKVAEMGNAIRGIEQGAALNVSYGDTAPADTSKLWVKCNKPNNVIVSPKIVSPEEYIDFINISSELPVAMFGMAVAAVGTKLYLFGGNLESNKVCDTIYVFDTETNILTELDTVLPKANCKLSVAVIGTKIYLIGGYSDANSIHIFDTETNTIIDTIPNSHGGVATGVGVIGTKIYLFGGNSDKISVFDTETNVITPLSTKLPKVMEGHQTGVVGSNIYILGGHNYSTALTSIYVFDTTDNSLTELDTTLPSPHTYSGCSVYGTDIYLFGGYSARSGNPLSDILIFNADTNTVKTLSQQLYVPLGGLGCGRVGDIIYMFGGAMKYETNRSNLIAPVLLNTPLPAGDVLIQTDMTTNLFPLINGETAIETGIKHVYIGSPENKLESVEAYLHNGTEWTLI